MIEQGFILANKKIWAYAKRVDGSYVPGEKHPLKIYYIWDALKLKKENIHQFNKLTFMSTHKDVEERAELSVVKTGFYRYKKLSSTIESRNGDSDSLSHSIAIQVLAEMEEINFVLSDDCNFTLCSQSIRSDDLKIQLTNRDKYSYYYPDLICEFNKPANLVKKWGGKLAIEVKHTHACEAEKVYDFENHGIPIIEVNIEKISLEKKFNIKNPTADDLEMYYNYLKFIFGKQVYGRILSDPVSVEYYNDSIKTLNNEIYSLKLEIKKQNDCLAGLRGEVQDKKRDISLIRMELDGFSIVKKELDAKCDRYALKLNEYKRCMDEMESRGLWHYIIKMFRVNH